jgi:hypothetical protein
MTRKQQMRKIVRTCRRSRLRPCDYTAANIVREALGIHGLDWPEWLDDLWNTVYDVIKGQQYLYGRYPILIFMDVLCSELGECP